MLLGKPGLKVSPFCLGLVNDWRSVPAAFDAGINFFFLSGDLHWPLYENLRRGLSDLLARGPKVRQQIVVAAATYVGGDYMMDPFCEAIHSVRNLKKLDLLVVGGVQAYDYSYRLTQLKEIAQKPLLGAAAIGMSFHDRKIAKKAFLKSGLDMCFARYNPVHPGAIKDLFPGVRQKRGRRPLLYNFKSTYGLEAVNKFLGADGFMGWRPGAKDFYKFALARPEIDGILCSLHSPKEVAQLSDAMANGPLTPEQEFFLRKFFLIHN